MYWIDNRWKWQTPAEIANANNSLPNIVTYARNIYNQLKVGNIEQPRELRTLAPAIDIYNYKWAGLENIITFDLLSYIIYAPHTFGVHYA